MTIYPEINIIPIDRDKFILAQDCFISEFNVTLKKGTETDLASIPRFLWWLIPPNGSAKRSSIVHDCLIREGFDKDYSDAVYFYYLTKDVPKWQYLLIILGLRLFPSLRSNYEKNNQNVK